MDKRVCPICGNEIPKSAHYNQKYCSAQCRVESAKRYNKELRQLRKQQGLCTVCGKEQPIKGQLVCWQCSANNKDFCKAKYESRKKRHICHQCGKPVDEDRVICPECSTKRNRKQKLTYELRKLNNQCVKCGKKLLKGDNHALCKSCNDKIENSKKKAA